MSAIQGTLIRNGKIPLYQQLYTILKADITHGGWKPGDLFPTEPELMDQFGVSRITVRQVMEMLSNEGLVVREQGRGTFIAKPTLEEGLTRIMSFTEDMERRGAQPETKMLFSEVVPAPPDVAERLGVEPGELTLHYGRLRMADGEPLSIEVTYLLHRYCANLLSGNYENESMRRGLEEKCGIRLTRAKQNIRAILASKEWAALLTIPQRSPLLQIERVSYTDAGIPIEFLHIYYRGDRYTLYAELGG